MCNSTVQGNHPSSSSLFPVMTVHKCEGSKPGKRQIWSETYHPELFPTHIIPSLSRSLQGRLHILIVSFYGQDTELH